MDEFDHKILTHPGCKHGNADGLSRGLVLNEDDQELLHGDEDEPKCLGLMALDSDGEQENDATAFDIARLSTDYTSDDWYSQIVEEMSKSDYEHGMSRWRMAEGQLLRCDDDGNNKICVREEHVRELLRICHSSRTGGHFGVEMTLRTLRGVFWWTTMR